MCVTLNNYTQVAFIVNILIELTPYPNFHFEWNGSNFQDYYLLLEILILNVNVDRSRDLR